MEIREEHKVKTRQLIQEGHTIEAIKYLRQSLNLDLKTALQLVEALKDSMDPATIKDGAPVNSPTSSKNYIIVPVAFSVVGLIMLGITAYIYSTQYDVISQGNRVVARVVSNPSSPLFEYEFEGKTYQYQSSASSNPPSYSLNEEVVMYVDSNNPYNGIVDTFTDRWLVIVILGGMGAMFFGIGTLVGLVFRKSTISMADDS